MANLDRIIKADISLKTAGISSQGFSTIMVVGPHSYTLERVISVTDVDQLLDVGFKSEDKIYKAVSDAMSQIPRPSEVKVGKIQCDTVKVGIVGEVTESEKYAITIVQKSADGKVIEKKEFSHIAGSEESAAAVLNAIATAVTSDDVYGVAYSAAVLSTTLSIRSTSQAKSFVVTTTNNMTIVGFDKSESISLAESMNMISAEDNDFYGVCFVDKVQKSILEMADWCEAHTKLYGTSISEEGAKSNESITDTGCLLKNGNYFRTYWFYHADASEDFPEVAVMAKCFAVKPGGETWANKQLGGITTDGLKENEYQAITKKNGNTFEAFRNLTITQNGKVAAGEWIDVIRFRDWLVETIQTEMFSMLINKDKLPYTDSGIAMVENVLNSVLALGQRRGGISPTEYDENGQKNVGYIITVPLASNISPNQKAQRKLEDVNFMARLSGAIHAINITGSVTYENLIQK